MLKPNKAMHYACWISPEGHIYSCPAEAHKDLASQLIFEIFKIAYENQQNPEKFLEGEGWLKITASGFVIKYDDEITKKQYDALGEFLSCKHHTEPPRVIKNWIGSGDRYMHGNEIGWKNNIQRAIHFYTIHPERIVG